MRSIDLDMARTKNGEFTYKGNKYEVYEPSIGLLMAHTKERLVVSNEIDNIQKENEDGSKNIEVVDRQNKWAIREIQMFFPNFTDEDVLNMTYSQRSAIMNMVFSMDNENEDDEEKKTDPEE